MNRLAFLLPLSASLSLTACNGDKGDSGATAGQDGLTCTDGFCTLPNEILEDLTLTNEYAYVLSGGVFVGNGTDTVTLTIDPGVTIYGEPQSFLAIQQNSLIDAVGTEDAPIVFTSPQPAGSRNRADWGGLILNGKAPINNCSDGSGVVAGCTAEGEGSTGTYGGDDPTDSSGTLKYVRVEFGGYEITPENEVNGIAFQGVGSGTSVSYIQVHMNKDDGVEFYGGTVSADHIVITGAGDDSLDWTDGWSGSATNVLIQQAADLGDRGIEADNNGDQNAAQPVSNPTLSRVTILGAGAESVGMLLREGTNASISDVVVQGSGSACFDVDQDATFANADAGTLSVTNTVLSCDTYFKVETDDGGSPEESFDIQAWFEGQAGNSTTVNPGLTGFLPDAGSPLIGAGTGGGTIGAFDEGDDWASAWIITAAN
jgi:hypothetical protein